MIISEYIDILLKRRLMIAVVAAFALAASFFVGKELPQTYESSAYLRVLPYSSGSVGYESSVYFDRLVNTLIETSGGVSVETQLEQRLDVDEAPEYEIALVAGTELLKITASDEDPERAQEIVSILASLMLDQAQLSTDGGTGSTVDQLERDLEDAEDDLTELQNQYNELLATSPFEVDDINALQQKIASQQNYYNIVLENYTLAKITQTIRMGSVSLAEPPTLPEDPSNQPLRLTLVVGGALGVIGGVFLALIFEAFDRRIYSTANVTEITSLPIIGSVPHLSWMNRRRLSTRHSASQSYRRIAAHISQCGETGHGARIVLFCSPQPGEGKSTLVANLALSFASQGYKVAVVDGDLHRSNLHKTFDVKLPRESRLKSLKKLLFRNVQEREVTKKMLYHTKHGVDIALPNARGKKSTVNRTFWPRLLHRMEKVYEIILVDSPAVMAVADALEMVRFSDDVILVARRTQTKQTTLRDTFSYLSQVNANWMGVVLNDDKAGNNKRWYSYYNR
jgi:polysaccharide biosynthesis transport protein